jgi:nucleoside-diphosphate-sugar epimerase
VADADAVLAAARDRDVVFHVAAKVGLWGKAADYERVNVRGTENVLAACRKAGVRRLVFTGSPSVVFDGRDVEGWDESAPYARRFDSDYSRTKAISENLVLKADGADLSTVSLRPHLVWGPGENHIVSRIVSRGKAGKLRRIAGYDKLVDTTYIDDAVEAHFLAALRLAPGSAVSGKAYFISQGDPRPLWWVVNGILEASGVPPVTRAVPRPLAYAAATLLEGAYRLAGIEKEPRLTRFLVSQLSTAHWFDISAARRDLGYRPQVSLEEGMRRLKEGLARSSRS